MKAKPTKWRGISYRSRTEARWVVFFEQLGIRFEYEKEHFHLANGLMYLPDFWLPDQDCWFEVKGTNPSVHDQEKIVGLAKYTNKRVILAIGGPSFKNKLEAADPQAQDWKNSMWVRCPDHGIQISDHSEFCLCGLYTKQDKWEDYFWSVLAAVEKQFRSR